MRPGVAFIVINVLVWNEYYHELKEETVAKAYPNGIHNAIREFLAIEDDIAVTVATFDEPEYGLNCERVDAADVIIWWGHVRHDEVPDEIAERVANAVLQGCGFIGLHSAHMSKPFRKLMGTTCHLRWRDGDRERIYTVAPYHQIARGIPDVFEIPDEEMYGERFDIPNPTDVVFMGWFAGGEVFRSGVTFDRGYGKVFYFQPGHETNPIYGIPVVQDIIKNAVRWAARCNTRQSLESPGAAESPEKNNYTRCR